MKKRENVGVMRLGTTTTTMCYNVLPAKTNIAVMIELISCPPSLDTGGKTWRPIFGMKSAAEQRKRVKGQRGPVSQRLELLTETVSYYTLT